jgi:ribosomal protein S18 acetylase RimI-like enzyme
MTTVRRASAADAAAIVVLNADVQGVHAAALPWRFKPPGPGTFTLTDAAALIAAPNHVTFIAEVAGDPAGYAYAEVVRRPETAQHHAHQMVYLHHISVRPDYRRKGVGRALIEAVRAAGKDAGIDLLALDVWSFNDAARAFFAGQGLRTYNERMWDR